MPELSAGLGSVAPGLFLLLTSREKGKGEPRIAVILVVLGLVVVILMATLVVKVKRSRGGGGGGGEGGVGTSSVGKFRNPLRNVNVSIACVLLLFLLLQVLSYYLPSPPGLLFPRMPQVHRQQMEFFGYRDGVALLIADPPPLKLHQ